MLECIPSSCLTYNSTICKTKQTMLKKSNNPHNIIFHHKWVSNTTKTIWQNWIDHQNKMLLNMRRKTQTCSRLFTISYKCNPFKTPNVIQVTQNIEDLECILICKGSTTRRKSQVIATTFIYILTYKKLKSYLIQLGVIYLSILVKHSWILYQI